MTQKDIERKQIILIKYIQDLINKYSTSQKWKVVAEYSTDDNKKRVVTIQEVTGQKVVFFGNCSPLYNYYMIDIYGLTIRENKNLSLLIGNLIGESVYIEDEIIDDNKNHHKETWQIIFSQFTNPQAIEYMDIRRIGYNMTMQCIVNKIKDEII